MDKKKGLDIKFSLKGREIKKFSLKINLAKNPYWKGLFSLDQKVRIEVKNLEDLYLLLRILKKVSSSLQITSRVLDPDMVYHQLILTKF